MAFALAIVHRRSIEELRERDERHADRERRRAERKARRALGVAEPVRREPTFELGRHVRGDAVLPTRRGRVLMPLARLGRTLLVIGSPGSGKTVTLARLAYGVANTSDWQVVVIDAKGDPATQQAFAAAMRQAGRTPRLFPQEPYDAWRGTGREITNRLIALVDWPRRAAAPITATSPSTSCGSPAPHPAGRRAAREELLRRLDKTALLGLWAGRRQAAEIARFGVEHIDACRQRYGSFFDATDGQLDGHLGARGHRLRLPAAQRARAT